MDISINPLAVVIAALSTMVVGSLWYTPMTFGNMWMKLAKVKRNSNLSAQKMAVLYGGAFLASVVTALVLAYFAEIAAKAMGGNFLSNTLLVGFMCWIGFTAARLYMHDTFEGRPMKLTLLNIAHEFVTVAVMSVIIGLFGV